MNASHPAKKRRTPLSRWLVTERMKRGLSQNDLAKLAGISKPTLVNIETGKAAPRPATLYALAKALGASAEYVFELMRETEEED